MIRKLLARLAAGIVVASIWSASASNLNAQQTTTPNPAAKSQSAKREAKPATTIAAGDSVSTADIERAAEQLAAAVQAAVKKASEDPAMRVAALKVATNAVNAAQLVITQQAATLQTVLDSLAREIAVATEKQQAKPKAH